MGGQTREAVQILKPRGKERWPPRASGRRCSPGRASMVRRGQQLKLALEAQLPLVPLCLPLSSPLLNSFKTLPCQKRSGANGGETRRSEGAAFSLSGRRRIRRREQKDSQKLEALSASRVEW